VTRPRAGRSSRGAATLASLTALAGAAACDPCAGVGACRTDPQVSYAGRIIDFAGGQGVAGVAVVFRPTGGVGLEVDSLVAQTDGEGRFRFVARALGAGEVLGTVTVRPPAPRLAYAIPGVRLATTGLRGDAGVLDTWTAQPYVAWVASVVTRRGPGAAWAFAKFRRTGGARLDGGDVLNAELDPNGFFYLEASALDTGTVTGELEFYGANLVRNYRVENVAIPVHVVEQRARLDRILRIGASLDYALELRRRGTWAPLAGAEVVFTRRRGLRLERDTVTGTANDEGYVRLSPVPATDSVGEVVGDLLVRGGGLRTPQVIRDVRLQTFDSDELRYRGLFGVGYSVQVAGELFHRGDRLPLADAEVRFVRTGGLETGAPSATARSRADGWFGFGLAADGAGEVLGDLIVAQPNGAPSVTFPGVRLRAAADDSVRLAGRWGVGAQFGYAGVLVNRATGSPAAGWTVTFRRTSGIPLLRDSVTSTVLDWGGFDLHPPTRDSGTVQGTLTARSPSGDRAVPLGSVRLTTWDSDSVQLAGRWAIGPSLLYVGELLRADNGAPVVGARAEFRRTGGVRTVEPVVGETTNAVGRFRMAPTPLDSGEVVGDVYVFPPAPLRDTVFRDVRLRTFESDETRLHTVWRLAVPR
jgi:hypothetical protein